MKKALFCITALLSAAAAAETINLPDFGTVEAITLPEFGTVGVIDEVDCTKTDHRFEEFPVGASRVETILGQECRVMPVHTFQCSMFKYRLGEGKGLKPNLPYVIVLEYPDDLPRNYIIVNRATDSHRSFFTGLALGDCWKPRYVADPPEMLDIPQSGEWQRWTCLTSLQDFTADYQETHELVFDERGFVKRGYKDAPVTKRIRLTTGDGFDFCVAQYGREHDPVSNGIAVRRILLCLVPDELAIRQKITYPAEGLPRRHIFWREEMSDGSPLDPENPACVGWMPWFYHKASQMHFLGINTYTKDLMEFGHVQHWAPGVIATGWAWDGPLRWLWQQVVPMMARQGFYILPYYEWCGNLGWDHGDYKTLGPQKRAKTLNGEENYTQIAWSEKANIDITDPDSLVATKQLLDGTILRFTNEVQNGVFVGALFRTRPAQWPVGFGDLTLARFVADELDNEVDSLISQEIDPNDPFAPTGTIAPNSFSQKYVTREALRKDHTLYKQYLEWWHRKRAQFLNDIHEYLVERGLPEAQVILDAEASEPGTGSTLSGIITDNPDAVAAVFAKPPFCTTNKTYSVEQCAKMHGYLEQRRRPASTYDKWEWQHACPGDDPENYNKFHNTSLAMPINRTQSVTDPAAFEAYSTADGTQTIIRHHSLNENMLTKFVGVEEKALLGYAIQDAERAGRGCMLNEVLAMAYGDPVNIGYLIGSTFARGFPGPVREFNSNFLALPALKSSLLKNASSDPKVFLRRIPTKGDGNYFALVNTGYGAKENLTVRFPAGTGPLTAIVSGRVFTPDATGAVTFDRVEGISLLSLREAPR